MNNQFLLRMGGGATIVNAVFNQIKRKTGMIKLEFNTVIEQPIAKVFSFLANPENETQWQTDLVEAKLTSDGPIGVGATGRDVRTFMGRETVTTWQVTAFEPNQKIVFKVIAGPMPFEGAYLFEVVDGATRFTYRVQSETPGFAKLFAPLISRIIKSQGQKQMAALKRALESQGTR